MWEKSREENGNASFTCSRCTRNYCPLTGNLKLKPNRNKKAFSQICRHTLLCVSHSILQVVVSLVWQLRAALYWCLAVSEASSAEWCFNNQDFVVSGWLLVRQRGTYITHPQCGAPRNHWAVQAVQELLLDLHPQLLPVPVVLLAPAGHTWLCKDISQPATQPCGVPRGWVGCLVSSSSQITEFLWVQPGLGVSPVLGSSDPAWLVATHGARLTPPTPPVCHWHLGTCGL